MPPVPKALPPVPPPIHQLEAHQKGTGAVPCKSAPAPLLSWTPGPPKRLVPGPLSVTTLVVANSSPVFGAELTPHGEPVLEQWQEAPMYESFEMQFLRQWSSDDYGHEGDQEGRPHSEGEQIQQQQVETEGEEAIADVERALHISAVERGQQLAGAMRAQSRSHHETFESKLLAIQPQSDSQLQHQPEMQSPARSKADNATSNKRGKGHSMSSRGPRGGNAPQATGRMTDIDVQDGKVQAHVPSRQQVRCDGQGDDQACLREEGQWCQLQQSDASFSTVDSSAGPCHGVSLLQTRDREFPLAVQTRETRYGGLLVDAATDTTADAVVEAEIDTTSTSGAAQQHLSQEKGPGQKPENKPQVPGSEWPGVDDFWAWQADAIAQDAAPPSARRARSALPPGEAAARDRQRGESLERLVETFRGAESVRTESWRGMSLDGDLLEGTSEQREFSPSVVARLRCLLVQRARSEEKEEARRALLEASFCLVEANSASSSPVKASKPESTPEAEEPPAARPPAEVPEATKAPEEASTNGKGSSKGAKGGPGKAPAKGKGAAPPKGKAGKAGKAGKGASSAPEPLKADVVPNIPLKKLFWNRISLPGTVGAEGTKTVWEKIHEAGVRFDVEELESLFAEAGNMEGSGASPTRSSRMRMRRNSTSPNAKKRRQLFDEKRRRQIWFMLALMPGTSQVLEAVKWMDDDVLGVDSVDLLCSNLPSSEEEALLQGAEPLAQDEEFDAPEDFMSRLLGVPQYSMRIEVWTFLNSFEVVHGRLASAHSDVYRACELMQDSPVVERVLALVLYVGNYLNAGTSRGRADGFDLDTLPKLSALKACHNPMSPDYRSSSLVDFLARQLERDDPGMLKEAYLAGKEAQAVRRARRHRITELQEEVAGLVTQVGGLRESFERNGLASELEDRHQLLVERHVILQDLLKGFGRLSARYARLTAWLRMDADKPRPSDDFFGIWDTFLTDLKKSLDAAGRQAEQSRRARSLSFSGRCKTPPPPDFVGKDRRSSLPSPRRTWSEKAADGDFTETTSGPVRRASRPPLPEMRRPSTPKASKGKVSPGSFMARRSPPDTPR